jgi:hypothetical protein
MRLSSTVLAVSLIFPATVYAQAAAETAPAPAPASAPASAEPAPAPAPAPVAVETAAAPAPAPVPAAAPPIAFGWEALVDTYYLYNFTGKPKTEAPVGRQFDTTANNFSLNYAKLGVHAETSLVSFRMDIGAGHTAAIINGASGAASNPGTATAPGVAGAMYGSAFLVQQAFASVKLSPILTLDAGKFVTSASAEVIESNKNWLYSRSLLFFGVPLLHTGARLNIAPDPALTISLQIVNGWNNDPDINSDKTFGLNATYAPPNAGLLASLTSYFGKEGGADGTNTRLLIDGVFTKDIGNISVGANVDYFKLDTANWFGVAGMGRFILNDSFTVAARAEYVKSKNGAFVPGLASAAVYEVTGMGAYTVDKHYELRLEVRADMSDQNIFDKGGTPRKNQVTGLLAALAYF